MTPVTSTPAPPLRYPDAMHPFDVIYAAFFTEPRPARCCVATGALPFGARVEIDAVAYLPQHDNYSLGL